MEVGTNNQVRKSYEDISKDIQQLYEEVKNFKNKQKTLALSISSFEEDLGGRRFNHPFPKVEEEVNSIIGKWNLSVPLDSLKAKLEEIFTKLAFVDKEIDGIKGLQQKLQHYPDRHNRKEVTDKIDVFLKKVSTISLSQLDKICNEVIPSVHKMVDSVHDGFSKEKKMVEKNKQAANMLTKRVGGMDKLYVDRFHLFDICAECRKVADQVLQTPNMLNPDADAIRIQKANQALDQCLAKFDAEDNLFKKLKQELESNCDFIWREDYDALYSKLEKGARYELTPASQLQAVYQGTIGVKQKDVDQAVSGFSNEIQSYFSNEIQSLKNTSHKRSDLQSLIDKMNRKVAEDKKKHTIKLIKIACWILAIILFIALMVGFWPISGIVLGVIIAVVVYFYIKG